MSVVKVLVACLLVTVGLSPGVVGDDPPVDPTVPDLTFLCDYAPTSEDRKQLCRHAIGLIHDPIVDLDVGYFGAGDLRLGVLEHSTEITIPIGQGSYEAAKHKLCQISQIGCVPVIEVPIRTQSLLVIINPRLG